MNEAPQLMFICGPDNTFTTEAPRKVAEGLGRAQKGIGGKPNYAVFGADGQPQEGVIFNALASLLCYY
jgi:hypothetical protein